MNGREAVVIVAAASVLGAQVAFTDEHSGTLLQPEHIHQEMRVDGFANTTSATRAFGIQLYRAVAFSGARVGAGHVWKPLPTREAAIQEAKSRGYAESELRIETVDREGKAPSPATWKDYPELSYRGIRP